MRRSVRLVTLALLIALLLPSAASAQTPVVCAVLFYSPSCGHCEYVIQEVLPPLFETHGDRLQIIGIDVTAPGGSELYASAIDAMSVPEGQRGVPMLVIGDVVLTGSAEIPEIFPGLIDDGMAQGGIDWPAIPGLAEVLGELEASAEDGSASPAKPEPSRQEPWTVADRLRQDPVGNTLAIVVLIGLLISLVAVGARWAIRLPTHPVPFAAWLVPLLALLGLGVAIYLTIIELSGDPAVCGPVGDCNAVQQTPYAFLFGAIPIGAIGVVGFGAIILVWAAARYLPGRAQDLMQIALFGMALIGTCFSIYLTFLEPFVIGATCAWCLTSAILQMLLLWLTADPARAAWARWQGAPATSRSLRGRA